MAPFLCKRELKGKNKQGFWLYFQFTLFSVLWISDSLKYYLVTFVYKGKSEEGSRNFIDREGERGLILPVILERTDVVIDQLPAERGDL